MAEWNPTRVQDQDDVDSTQIADGRVPVARDQGGGVFVHEYEAAAAGGAPSGAAGGALDGTYPNPGLAASVAGDGLAEAADVLSVNVDGSTIEIAADTLRVKDGGITAAKVAADVATQAELDAVAAAAVNDGDAAGGVLSGTYPNPGFAVDMATQAELDAHLTDAADAHDASAISFVPAGTIAATDVQAAINELDSEKAAAASAVMDGDAAGGVLSGTYPNPGFAVDMATQAELDAHVNDVSAAHAASAISADSTTLVGVATDVQGVLEELDNGIADHLADATDAHDASAISIADAGNYFTGTDVEAALQELGAGGGGGGGGAATSFSVNQTGHGFVVGDVVRLSGTNTYAKAKADSSGNAEVAGIVSAVADADNFTLTTEGDVTGLSGLTAATVYYLSPSTAGALTATEPSTPGQISKPLLIARSTTAGLFFNMRGATVADVIGLYESRSTNTILAAADRGKTIDITAAITQTLTAAATLGAGWWVRVRNATTDGTTVVTLDPNGSETIDGVTTPRMYSGETRMIVCDGANFHSVMESGGFAKFTADGTFYVPAAATKLTLDLIGAGGGGGGARGSAGDYRVGGSGGGGGGRVRETIDAASAGAAGASVAVTVGAGGSSGAGGDPGVVGGAGGATSFGSLVIAGGGGGGGRGDNSGNESGGGGGGHFESGETGKDSASARGGGNPSTPATNVFAAGMGGAGAGSYADGTNGTTYSAERGGGAGGYAAYNVAGKGGSSIEGGGGGGGGGGVNNAGAPAAAVAGGAGGTVGSAWIAAPGTGGGGAATGAAGAAGTAGTYPTAGSGGAGGGGNGNGNGGAGGAGGAPGGGGGGGGGGTGTGGAGGVGARGEARVWFE